MTWAEPAVVARLAPESGFNKNSAASSVRFELYGFQTHKRLEHVPGFTLALCAVPLGCISLTTFPNPGVVGVCGRWALIPKRLSEPIPGWTDVAGSVGGLETVPPPPRQSGPETGLMLS